jgi:hypothetical protein
MIVKMNGLLIVLFAHIFLSCVAIRDRFVVSMLESGAERENTIFSEQKFPGNITEILDIPYISDGHKGHLLDVYYPNNLEGPFPVIINIHGGGFMSSYKELNRLFGHNIASNGFIIFNINYRHAYFDTDIPGQISDVIHALDWIGCSLQAYPANEEKIYVVGESAGAYLTAMATLISKSQRLQEVFNVKKPEINIKALSLNCGFFEIERKGVQWWGMRSMLFNKGYKKQEYYKNLIFNSLPDILILPPVFITSNEDDELKFMTEYFVEILVNNGLEHTYYYPQETERKLGHVFNILHLDWEESKNLNNAMLEYLIKY